MGVLLVGGRYDGMTFSANDGWTPGPEVGVLYLGSTAAPKGEVTPLYKELPAGPVVATNHVSVPFAAREKHDPFDVQYHRTEVYLRCADGTYRTPPLAAIVHNP